MNMPVSIEQFADNVGAAIAQYLKALAQQPPTAGGEGQTPETVPVPEKTTVAETVPVPEQPTAEHVMEYAEMAALVNQVVAAKGKPAAVAVLARFNAKGLKDVAIVQYRALQAALEGELNNDTLLV